MVDESEISEGMTVRLTGRAATEENQEATVIDVGDILIRTPDSGPRTTNTVYTDVALVKDNDGRFVVAQLKNVELP